MSLAENLFALFRTVSFLPTCSGCVKAQVALVRLNGPKTVVLKHKWLLCASTPQALECPSTRPHSLLAIPGCFPPAPSPPGASQPDTPADRVLSTTTSMAHKWSGCQTQDPTTVLCTRAMSETLPEEDSQIGAPTWQSKGRRTWDSSDTRPSRWTSAGGSHPSTPSPGASASTHAENQEQSSSDDEHGHVAPEHERQNRERCESSAGALGDTSAEEDEGEEPRRQPRRWMRHQQGQKGALQKQHISHTLVKTPCQQTPTPAQQYRQYTYRPLAPVFSAPLVQRGEGCSGSDHCPRSLKSVACEGGVSSTGRTPPCEATPLDSGTDGMQLWNQQQRDDPDHEEGPADQRRHVAFVEGDDGRPSVAAYDANNEASNSSPGYALQYNVHQSMPPPGHARFHGEFHDSNSDRAPGGDSYSFPPEVRSEGMRVSKYVHDSYGADQACVGSTYAGADNSGGLGGIGDGVSHDDGYILPASEAYHQHRDCRGPTSYDDRSYNSSDEVMIDSGRYRVHPSHDHGSQAKVGERGYAALHPSAPRPSALHTQRVQSEGGYGAYHNAPRHGVQSGGGGGGYQRGRSVGNADVSSSRAGYNVDGNTGKPPFSHNLSLVDHGPRDFPFDHNPSLVDHSSGDLPFDHYSSLVDHSSGDLPLDHNPSLVNHTSGDLLFDHNPSLVNYSNRHIERSNVSHSFGERHDYDSSFTQQHQPLRGGDRYYHPARLDNESGDRYHHPARLDNESGDRYHHPARSDNESGDRYHHPARSDNESGDRYHHPARLDNESGDRYHHPARSDNESGAGASSDDGDTDINRIPVDDLSHSFSDMAVSHVCVPSPPAPSPALAPLLEGQFHRIRAPADRGEDTVAAPAPVHSSNVSRDESCRNDFVRDGAHGNNVSRDKSYTYDLVRDDNRVLFLKR
eukprot:gene28949-32142_t